MHYVNEESAVRAQEWARRFQKLPPLAGVIFVGVDALPELNGVSSVYEIRLGLSRRYAKETGLALVKQVLEKEVEEGRLTIHVAVYRGVSGACYESNAGTGTPTS